MPRITVLLAGYDEQSSSSIEEFVTSEGDLATSIVGMLTAQSRYDNPNLGSLNLFLADDED